MLVSLIQQSKICITRRLFSRFISKPTVSGKSLVALMWLWYYSLSAVSCVEWCPCATNIISSSHLKTIYHDRCTGGRGMIMIQISPAIPLLNHCYELLKGEGDKSNHFCILPYPYIIIYHMIYHHKS